jgi:hypothetical protein
VAGPRPDPHLPLNLTAQQIDERQAVAFSECIPNRALKAVVFAAEGDRQLLAGQFFEIRSDEA